MREEITIQKILDKKPDVPYRWIVFNAPRPLKGDLYWEGEFVTGRFYAAVNPAGSLAKWCVQENANLRAVLCEYVNPQDIDKWAREEFKEDYEVDDRTWHRQTYMAEYGSKSIPISEVLALCVMACDLCGDPCGERMLIEARSMASAAENGFCPVAQGLIQVNCQADLDSLSVMGVDFSEVWHDDAIRGFASRSDWNVCSECLMKLLPYLPTTQEQEA